MALLWKGYFLLSGIVASFSIYGDDCALYFKELKDPSRLGELRVKAIESWDQMITWALSKRNRDFSLAVPLQVEEFQVSSSKMRIFDRNHGYFSPYDPLVGSVTQDSSDFKTTVCLLSLIHQVKNEPQRRFSTEEVIAKVLAYRSLKKGSEIPISTFDDQGNSVMGTYVVDEILDLWHGMPAFGLIPKEKNISASILLFRGTDLSLTTERGWASIMSDLDITGPGHATFKAAEPKIREWLLRVAKMRKPARVIGTSLGGAFVFYTVCSEYALVNKSLQHPSVAFNPPGISQEILKKWKEIPKELQPELYTYVSQGDYTSKIGFLIGKGLQMSIKEYMQVIQAHTTLISTQPTYYLTLIDVEAENASR